MAEVFYEGAAEFATLANTFTVAGTATDPTAVSLTVTSPAGVSTTYAYSLGEVTRDSAGVYHKDIACTEDGTWAYAWTGTVAASDIQVGTWTVFSTDVRRRYCSLEELKSRMGIAATDTADDLEISLALDAASRWIDQHCARYFWRGTATRTYSPSGLYCLPVDDLVSVTSVKTDPASDGSFATTWSAADYQLLPVNPAALGEDWPFTSLDAVGAQSFPFSAFRGARRDLVQVVGVFGWPSVPTAVKQAALLLSAEFVKLKDAPFGVAGFGEFGAVRVRANPQVASLLAPYRKHPVMVA